MISLGTASADAGLNPFPASVFFSAREVEAQGQLVPGRVSSSLAELRRRRAWKPDHADHTKICPRCLAHMKLEPRTGFVEQRNGMRVWGFHASWWYICDGCQWIASPDLFQPLGSAA